MVIWDDFEDKLALKSQWIFFPYGVVWVKLKSLKTRKNFLLTPEHVIAK